ncbi:MAG: PQQ-like beta-propeller repeat protein, partial [Prolixibacteraceae bacterium]|nr:PQQ-like beta-propeller repeat protein [Prolixibacteraceae bacterium]
VPDDSVVISMPGNLYLSFALGKDAVYYGAAGGFSTWLPARVYAVNSANGNFKWRSEALDHIDFSSQIIVDDEGTVYVIGFYKLYAIDPANGAFKWVWEVPTTIPHPDYPNGLYTYGQIGCLALTNNGDLVLGSIGSGVYHRCLYCIGKDGNTKWYNVDAVGGMIATGISIGKNGNLFYYSTIDAKNSLISVDAQSGLILWSKPIQAWGGGANNIVVDDEGNLICSYVEEGASEYHLYSIDPADGSVLWKSNFLSTAQKKWIGPDGYYYHYLDRNVEKYGVYRIASYSNDVTLANWDFHLGAIDNQNRLVHTFTDKDDFNKGKLGIFKTDGTIDWSIYIYALRNSDFLLSDNKVIYGVVGENQLIAIQGDATLANTGWPKLAHDNRNTSNWGKH